MCVWAGVVQTEHNSPSIGKSWQLLWDCLLLTVQLLTVQTSKNIFWKNYAFLLTGPNINIFPNFRTAHYNFLMIVNAFYQLIIIYFVI